MSVAEVIIRLVIVGLLTGYLVSKHRERVRDRYLNRTVEPEDPAIWTGTGIDTSTLKRRIERVRHDYPAARHAPACDIGYRRGLLALMGRAIAQLSFFKRRRSEEDAHEHAT